MMKKDISPAQAEALRSLPSVEEIIEAEALAEARQSYGRELVVQSVRNVLDRIRQGILAGQEIARAAAISETGAIEVVSEIAAAAAREAQRVALPNLRTIINATGVVLHTNLGRAVLAPEAIDAVMSIASSYSNLEYDLEAGRRGSRHDHITKLLVALTGAEDALVVNNNAAAVLLALAVFGSGREVVISRGELIEIGGSFRIPDIMASSSARMVEVGTTNKTKLSDYESAIGPETAMLLHVHTSNYKVVGFTAEVNIADLARLGHERGVMVAHDLGSGALADLPALADEPSVFDSLASGADIVTFSGDKLLGGPQAGIVVGKSEYIARMKKHPMARAMRVDKMTLAALQATLALYLKPDEAIRRIPTLRMLNEPESSLRARAEKLAGQIRGLVDGKVEVEVEKSTSKVGGGSLPLVELETYVCSVIPADISVDELSERLHHTDPAVVGRIQKEKLLLDLRTILPGQGVLLATAIAEALESTTGLREI